MTAEESRDAFAKFERVWGRWDGGVCDRKLNLEHLTLHSSILEPPGAVDVLKQIFAARGKNT